MLVVLVEQLVRLVGDDAVALVLQSDAAHVERAHQTHGEEALVPAAVEHHALVQREQALHLVRVVRLHRQQLPRHVHSVRHADVRRGVDAVVVRRRQVQHDGIQVVLVVDVHVLAHELVQVVANALDLVELDGFRRGEVLFVHADGAVHGGKEKLLGANDRTRRFLEFTREEGVWRFVVLKGASRGDITGKRRLEFVHIHANPLGHSRIERPSPALRTTHQE